ncbi:hypothetical protein M5K25_003537 [Dendrobium thyrsiflorum]|uniref:Cytochrome P450 n=1 Tax=Dendrobium thyrsiflorum TaxID=117978 RepID=A0ABD0VJH9_DENTH
MQTSFLSFITEYLPHISTSIALLVVFFAYLYTPYWSLRSVPGPPPLPLLGHLPLFAKHGPQLFTILANRHGPIYRFHMGRQVIVIVASPELCYEVGIKKFKSINRRSIPPPIAGSPLHQKGLFFARDYSKWTAMRNTIISLYQPSHLASLIPTMQSFIESATSFLSKSQEEGNVDIIFSDLSLKLATDIISQAAFGFDFGLLRNQSPSYSNNNNNNNNNNEVSEFIKEHIYSTTSLKMDLSGSFSIILALLIPILQEPFRQVLKRIPWTADYKIERTNSKLSKKLDSIVAQREREKERGRKNFLSAILCTREEEGEHSLRKLNFISSDYISSLAYEHLLAGSTTTSFTISCVIYLVSKHEEVEKKLLREIDGFGPSDLLPTADDLQHKFPYLDLVVKEAMRLYTVSPLIARETNQQVDIGGYLLPKGTWVWLAPGVLAMDPKHFPDPHLFRPERFDPTGEEEKRRHPHAHIPFGLGPRACIGQKFSLQEIKLTVIHLYRNYIFRHSSKMEFPLQFQFGIVVNFKHGVKLQAIKRWD